MRMRDENMRHSRRIRPERVERAPRDAAISSPAQIDGDDSSAVRARKIMLVLGPLVSPITAGPGTRIADVLP